MSIARRSGAPAPSSLVAASPARAVWVGPLAGLVRAPTDYHLGALCRVLGRAARTNSAVLGVKV